MSTELHLTPDDSMRLDLLLAHYLRDHPVAQERIIRSPWREAEPSERIPAAGNALDAPWSASPAYGALRNIRSG